MIITWKPILKELPMLTPLSYGFKVNNGSLTMIMWISKNPEDKEFISVDLENCIAEIPDELYNKRYIELFYE